MAENPISTPLPADLPTNWTYGQTIAPSGAEAGLSEQHGYNYLMRQVNSAQEGVNALGEALVGVPTLVDGKVPVSQLPAGTPNGVAGLDSSGKVPSAQLPDLDYDPAGSANAVQANLTTHTNNKSNPHEVTVQQIGAAAVSHNHSAGEITSGTLSSARLPVVPISKGGTGKTTAAEALAALGGVSAASLAAYDKTIKGTYPIATGNSVTAGDVVDVVNGEVTRSVVAEANVINQLWATAKHTTRPAIKKMSDKYSLVVAWVSIHNQLFELHIEVIDNETNKAIDQRKLYSNSSDIINYISIAVLSPNHAVVSYYKYGQQAVSVQISDNGAIVSVGNEYGVNGSLVGGICEAVDNDRVIFFGKINNRLYGVILSVSESNTFTNLRQEEILLEQYPDYISAIQLPNSTATQRRFLVSYKNTSLNNVVCLVVGFDSTYTMTTGNTISIPTNTTAPSMVLTDSGRVAITFINSNSFKQYVEILTVNDYVITRGTPFIIGSNNRNVTSIAFVSKKLVVGAPSQNNNTAVLLSVSENTLTKVLDYEFAPNYICQSCSFSGSGNQIMVVFGINDGFYLTALEVNGNQIAGGFTVNSTQAIALESGEAGQEIEVIFAGTTAADFVTEGQKIPSDGVYGYGPMAGWLNVIPYWAKDAGVRIATGSYVGTGTYGNANPNSLTFEFEPKFVIVSAASGGVSRLMFQSGQTETYQVGFDSGDSINTIVWSGNTVSWYVKNPSDYVNADEQMNQTNMNYIYLAIG